MPVFRLTDEPIFPSPEFAEPDGLLAIGGDLHPARLITAYSMGIFPWFTEEDPLLWWSPVPRLVLYPAEFHLPKRLKRLLKSNSFAVSSDTAFAEVIAGCATASGRKEKGTWITPAMRQAYIRLYELGFAHSIECWQDGQLAGGLYGVHLDRVFFGESMFSRITNASKVALATLVRHALRLDIAMIDCQMATSHLVRFGARELSRTAFQEQLATCIGCCLPQETWRLPPS